MARGKKLDGGEKLAAFLLSAVRRRYGKPDGKLDQIKLGHDWPDLLELVTLAESVVKKSLPPPTAPLPGQTDFLE